MVKVEAKVMHKLDNEESAYRGTVRVVLGEALSTSVTVMQGNNGLFISFPSYFSEKEEKYKNIINPVTKEAWEAITGTALKAFSDNSGKAVLKGDTGLSVTRSFASYLANGSKAGIGTVVVGDCLKIDSISIYEKKERQGDYYVNLPSRKGEKDGKDKYYPYAYPLTTKLSNEIEIKMIEALEESRKLAEAKEKGQGKDERQMEEEQFHKGKGR